MSGRKMDDEKTMRESSGLVKEVNEAKQQRGVSWKGSDSKDSPSFSDEIAVGTILYKGEIKRYAFVSPSSIASQYSRSISELLQYWELAPDFIVEMNASTRGKGHIINDGNAPRMLKDLFFPEKKEESKKPKGDTKKEETEEGNTGKSDTSNNADDAKDIPTDMDAEEWKVINEFIQEADSKDSKKDGQHENDPAERSSLKVIDGFIEEADSKDSKKDDPAEKSSLDWANKYARRKIVQALSGVVSASDMLDGFILCHGPPTTNERLMEAAIDLTRSDPKVIVIDDLANPNYKQFNDVWKGLKKNAKHLKKLVTDEREEENKYTLKFPIEDDDVEQTFLSRHSTVSWPKPTSHDSFQWDTATGENKNEGKMPWMRGTHFIFTDAIGDINADSLGRSGYICVNGGGTNSSFRKQTGYVIRQSVTTISPCLLFSNTGAETQTYARLIDEITQRDGDKRLEQCEENAKNAKLLAVAERKTKSCFKWVCCCYYSYCAKDNDHPEHGLELERDDEDNMKSFYEELRTELRRDALKLRNHANLGCDGQESSALLNVADVLHIVDLYTDNPRVFRSVVVPCDPFNESTDSIARKLMLSFERSKLEQREIGAGDADNQAIESAWRLHHQLDESKRRKDRSRSILYFLYIFAGLLTTWASVAAILIWNDYCFHERGDFMDAFNFTNATEFENLRFSWLDYKAVVDNLEEQNEKANAGMRWVVMGLAIVVSLSSSVLSTISADQQLLKIQNAQARILSEMFQFRMRVGRYCLDANDSDEEGKAMPRTKSNKAETRDEEIRQKSNNTSTQMMIARKKFSLTMEDISTDLTSIDLYFDRLAQGDMSKSDRQRLELYVREKLRLDSINAVRDGDDEMALSGVMTSWDYYRLRVLPSLGMVEKTEDSLRTNTRLLQVATLVASTTAVIISAIGDMTINGVYFETVSIIPGIVALATMFSQFLKVYDYERRFHIASSAAREFSSLNSYWLSLSDLSRYKRGNMSHLVATCEKLALQFETTSAIQVDKSEIGMDDEELKGMEQKLGFSFENA